MFPNVRLLVAATLASIVILICGFGMFAALRVSHAPLFRPLLVAASPQPLADNAAITPLAFAPSGPFDRRFGIGVTDRSDAVEAFTRFLARRENIKSPPAASPAAPEPGAIATKEEPIAIETPKDVPAAPGTPAKEQPAKAAPIANDAAGSKTDNTATGNGGPYISAPSPQAPARD
jgi:hypothetical protein